MGIAVVLYPKGQPPRNRTRKGLDTMTARNTPKHPGAMTPAELTKRTLHRIAQAVTAVAVTAVAIAIITALLSI